MTQTVLILGASGRFGRHAVQAFSNAGWAVRRFDRSTDDLTQAVRGVDVVVNGWNPPDYTTWARDLLAMHTRVIDALRGTDICVVVPGNVYVFGHDTPAPWSEKSPHKATHPLGQLRREVEAAYAASNLRTILLRAGDFLDTEASGNWFDMIITKSLRKGVLTYPGALDTMHAWAYLPDMARAAEQLATKRADLPVFCDVPFAGYAMTAAQMAQTMAQGLGRPVRAKQMSWLPLQVLRAVMPSLRGVCEMRYLWDTPHHLDGTRLAKLLPDFVPTPAVKALRSCVSQDLAAFDINPHKVVAQRVSTP